MSSTEGRIALALHAHQRGHIKSLRTAASTYSIPRTTLSRRSCGTPARVNSLPTNRKLTTTEEYTLVQWILDMDMRGMPPTKAFVHQMAELLLAERLTDLRIGKCWVNNFLKRHPELKSKYNRKYDYQRAKCEDPEIIRAWFRLVQNTVNKYGIQNDDIYNFDETGFQMGVISTAKVITASDRACPVSIQPGNREWVTVIESINASGWSLPPMVILKGQMQQRDWFENIPNDWTIGVSENGWTTDDLGFEWLKTVFDKYTAGRSVGAYRLLILDGHGSHFSPAFDQYCTAHSIIVLCMPAHSSHILQPLDVGCFAILKRYYGEAVAEVMRSGINHIDKTDFLMLYRPTRLRTFTADNIRSSFKATGLVPYNPEYVLT